MYIIARITEQAYLLAELALVVCAVGVADVLRDGPGRLADLNPVFDEVAESS
jgi:hypothetical protein